MRHLIPLLHQLLQLSMSDNIMVAQQESKATASTTTEVINQPAVTHPKSKLHCNPRGSDLQTFIINKYSLTWILLKTSERRSIVRNEGFNIRRAKRGITALQATQVELHNSLTSTICDLKKSDLIIIGGTIKESLTKNFHQRFT